MLAKPATGKTPDGQTPAEETVCDDALLSVWGLCNAYCEAMDCDSEARHASQRACDQVPANFLTMSEAGSAGRAPRGH